MFYYNADGFEFPIKLHYSQTHSDDILWPLSFEFPIKLHYSQTYVSDAV